MQLDLIVVTNNNRTARSSIYFRYCVVYAVFSSSHIMRNSNNKTPQHNRIAIFNHRFCDHRILNYTKKRFGVYRKNLFSLFFFTLKMFWDRANVRMWWCYWVFFFLSFLKLKHNYHHKCERIFSCVRNRVFDFFMRYSISYIYAFKQVAYECVHAIKLVGLSEREREKDLFLLSEFIVNRKRMLTLWVHLKISPKDYWLVPKQCPFVSVVHRIVCRIL